MQPRSLFASLALAGLLLAACGGSEPIPADAADAYEAGTSAIVANDYERARAAFTQVAGDTTAGDIIRYKALIGLGRVQAMTGDLPGAGASFLKARDSYASYYDVRSAKEIVDAFLNAGDAERADAELAIAVKRFPEALEALETQRRAIDAMRSGNTAELSELGYAGD